MGIRPAEFWELTYSEFITMFHGYVRAQRRRANEMLYTAWHTAMFTRAKEMPELKSVLIEEDAATTASRGGLREQTPEEQLMTLRVLNAALGGAEVMV